MRANEIFNRISALPAGGVLTTEQRENRPYVYSLMASYRGAVARLRFKENKTLHPAYYQKYFFEWSKDLQESDCFVKFVCPPAISLSRDIDGFGYIGTVPDGDSPSMAWQRVKTRPALSNYNNHPVMKKILDMNVSALWDNTTSSWEIYGNKSLRYGMTEAVFANPFSIPGYNMEADNFPMPEDDIALMEDMIYRGNTSIIFQKNPDILQNGNDLQRMTVERK